MDSLAQSLLAFRDSFYRCLDRRADALFELTDAILTAGSVPSPVHLSLATVHRRGCGSLYAALGRGRMDEGGMRGLLSRHPLGDRDPGAPPIYAVDVSVWPRCDAETSPERGYYYHPSRHFAGQPIVAGWAYQLVAQLGFERDSWVAPVDARRVRPTQDTDEVAAKQMGAERIVTMSRHEDRQKLALEFGATEIVTERGEEGAAKIKDMTDGLGAHSVVEAVGTRESMMQAIRSARPGGHVGFVGVFYGVELPLGELFFAAVHLHGGPAPVRRFLPELVDLIWDRKIAPGKVFDLTLPLEEVAEGYRAMDERRSIKTLLRP